MFEKEVGLLVLLTVAIFGESFNQLNWTPVYPSSSTGQVDLWTTKTRGCQCDFDKTRTDCACCVLPGGCQCGRQLPDKCAQCGLQNYCNNMCNMTIDSRTILQESRTTIGQIKSPSLQGPTSCWYLLKPEWGYRLELQIYRLVSVGKFNGTGCQHGHLQLTDEVGSNVDSGHYEICGENERFAPPIVLFADKGDALLNFSVEERTSRSQFLAYFSFTARNNSQGLGFRPVGGKRIENTGCDWLYQDFTCRDEMNGCVLASPGYPGLYPSHVTCKYHITISSLRTKVRIVFTTLSLPPNRCATDYINIYQGTSSSGSPLTTICSNKKQDLIYTGPNLLVEFNSGVLVPPYDYNGFVANLEFFDAQETTSQNLPVAPAVIGLPMKNSLNHFDDKTDQNKEALKTTENREACLSMVYGNTTRSGHFDTRTLPLHENCTIVFIGQLTDLVHISLFNYRLNEPSCSSYIEILDGNILSKIYKRIKMICSPVTRYARNDEGRFQNQQTFLSTGKYLSISFKRSRELMDASEVEYADGAFNFLDEYVEGTLQPNTLCNVLYYGVSSSPVGQIHNHGSQHLFWNVEGRLQCTQQFIPAANQSITIKIMSLSRLTSSRCHTECGDSGCQCVVNHEPVPYNDINFDRLLILNTDNKILGCICGNFQEEWLPITVRSWSPLSVIYSVAKYSWAEKGFSFEAEYRFIYDGTCGQHYVSHQSGSIQPIPVKQPKELNYYYNQHCVWILESKIDRQLSIEFESSQNRPCTAWNISIHKYVENVEDHCGPLLHTFCSRDETKEIQLPFRLNTVAIKLTAMTRILPEFQVRWHSQIIQTHTHTAAHPAEETLSLSLTASPFHLLLYITTSFLIILIF